MNASLNIIQPISSNLTDTFSLNTEKTKKVVSVALASIAFFSFQLGAPLVFGMGVAFAFSAITYLSEKLIRNESYQQNDWLSMEHIDKSDLCFNVMIRLVAIPILLGIGQYFGAGAPVQKITELIMSGDLKIILTATILAPIVEEILFRGFLQERFEDVTYLLNRYVIALSEDTQATIAAIAQGIVFGYVHIIGNQVKVASDKIYLWISLSLVGTYYGIVKSIEKSLVSPIAMHSAGNTGAVTGLLLFGRV